MSLQLMSNLSNLMSKFNALDEILNCPVCFERLSGNVPLCSQGHEVCQKCRSKINKCPLCNSQFYGTRNYLAENIITKFDEIKIALKSIHCIEMKTASPIVAEEKFLCGIEHCNQELTYNALIKHIQSVHYSKLVTTGVIKSYKYRDSWCLVYEPGTVFEKIYHIKNMGIFFLKIYTSNRGNIYGYIQNLKPLNNTHDFYYDIELDYPHDYIGFEGSVCSTSTLHQKGKYLDIQEALYEDDDGDEVFDVNILIRCTF